VFPPTIALRLSSFIWFSLGSTLAGLSLLAFSRLTISLCWINMKPIDKRRKGGIAIFRCSGMISAETGA
jgi:hypothetical protein